MNHKEKHLAPGLENPGSELGARIGADVHFVLDIGPRKGEIRSARITRLHHDRTADLFVFYSPGDFTEVRQLAEPLHSSVRFSAEPQPGTWSWA